MKGVDYLWLSLSILATSVSGNFLPKEFSASLNKRINTYGLPSGHLTTNGIAFGFLPSDGSATSPKYTMAQINSALGADASTYGWYSQITGSTYDGSQLTEVLSDVVASGAVFQPAIMPTLSAGFSGITPAVASQVASVLEQFTSQGVEVWLRFGHEMNYYDSVGTYQGTPAQFITAWKNIYAAVSSNSKIAMFWSPNNVGENQDASVLNEWFPGSAYVDIVGIDCYPSSSSTTFAACYSSFYTEFSAAYGKPFAIGETGADSSFKEAWLKQLVSQSASTYPNYIAASWFEYDKETDFRIVMTDSTTLAETQATLLGSSGGGSSSGTCTWGCYGWDCSSSVPCQTPYQCVSGYCKDCNWGCEGWDCSASVPCQSPYTCQSGYCH